MWQFITGYIFGLIMGLSIMTGFMKEEKDVNRKKYEK
jgi:hypothetical protein